MALDLVCEMSWVRQGVKKGTKHFVETLAMDNRPSQCVRTTPQRTRFRDVQHARIMATV